MRHFLQYHNVEDMGEPNFAVHGPHIFTNKSVKNLSSSIVWVIRGDGQAPKDYSIAAVFGVKKTSTDCFDHPHFSNAAYGEGSIFSKPIELNRLPWFQELREKVANFSLGLTEIRDQHLIQSLESEVAKHGS